MKESTPNLAMLSGYGDSYVVPGDEVYVVAEDCGYVYRNTGSNPPADGFNVVKALFLPGVWRRNSATLVGSGSQPGAPRLINVFGCRDFAEVRSITAPAAALPESLTVYCRSTPGDMGGGVFHLLSTSAPDDDGVVLRTASGAAYVRQYYGVPDVRWFGVIVYADTLAAYGPNGGIDSTAALNNALAACSCVSIPPGAVRIAGTITFPGVRRLLGAGLSLSYLLTDNVQTAILLPEFVSDRSTVGGLTIRTYTPHAGVRGIVVRGSLVTLHDVGVYGMGGHGIQVGEGPANSHAFRFYNIMMGSNGGDGLYVFYGNAGCVFGLSVLNGGGYGLRDETNTGSFYFGGHIEATAKGIKIGGGTSRTNVFAYHIESAQSEAYAPACVWGGTAATTWNQEAFDGSCLVMQDALTVAPFRMRSSTGVDRADLLLGSADGLPSPFGWAAPGYYSVENYRLLLRHAERMWRLTRNKGTADDDIVFEHTEFGHELRWSNMRIPNAVIGSGTRPNGGGKGVRCTSGTAAPSSGTWYLGWRHLHSDCGPGEPKEWVCVVQGGWPSTTRSNDTNVGRYTTISPVAGHLWECVVDSGVTASSPPVFTPGQTVVDGQVIWRYHGVSPPIFE